ncbi:hypothetical protein [Lysobacter gummosus]|uniref:hypothetical protein n=1 Tax=Lysobacter gummosus TaxID=262324 RepID=UPI003633FCBD
MRPRLVLVRNSVRDRLKTKNQALNALQQGIVKFARDAFAFGDAILQPAADALGDLRHAKLIDEP